MEFHPSYARADVRASGSPGTGPSAPSGGVAFLSTRQCRTPGASSMTTLPRSGAPRLINLERRAKFGASLGAA